MMAFKIEKKKNLGSSSYNSCQATFSAKSSLTRIVARTNTKKNKNKNSMGSSPKMDLSSSLGLGSYNFHQAILGTDNNSTRAITKANTQKEKT